VKQSFGVGTTRVQSVMMTDLIWHTTGFSCVMVVEPFKHRYMRT
jgi:hypothetical protein